MTVWVEVGILIVLPMNNPTDNLSKKVYALVIKRTSKTTPEKVYNSLLFYGDRSDAEVFAAKTLIPNHESFLTVECVIFDCDLYHCGNPLAFIGNTECLGIPNLTFSK